MSVISDLTLTPVVTRRHTGYVNRHVIVQIRCDDSSIGVGEMSDMSHLPRYMPALSNLEQVLLGLLKGRDPRDLEALNAALLEHFPPAHDYYDKSNFIRCGVDIALHDLVAKQLGEPVSTLLGGRCRERFKVCYPIFRHRQLEEVPANLDVAAARLEEGFNVIRLYVGANLEADVLFLTELEARFGEQVKVKSLDFSHLLDWHEARRVLERFADFDVEMVESPAYRNDAEGLAALRAATILPISEHVWSLRQLHSLIRHDAVDILNITPTFIGGLTMARRAFAVAAASGKRCLLGTTQELAIGTAAQAHLGAAMPNLTDTSDATGPVLYQNDVVMSGVRYEGGFLVVPPAETPGLGVVLSPARLAECEAPLSWDVASSASVLDRTTTA